MSGASYPVGTVAIATVRGVKDVRAMYLGNPTGEELWATGDPGVGGMWLMRGAEVIARPLLVLDPENEADVTRLRIAYYDEMRSGDHVSTSLNQDCMRLALHSLLPQPEPSIPPEPTGDVKVFDRDGDEWRKGDQGWFVACNPSDLCDMAWPEVVKGFGPVTIYRAEDES